jgi:hypothetical protein
MFFFIIAVFKRIQLLFSDYEHFKILGGQFILSGKGTEFGAKDANLCEPQRF